MKPMSLLVCGIVVSLLGAATPVHAEPQTGNFALRADTRTSLQAWKKEPVRGREPTEPAPRGDLRGDIASNVHARPDPNHGERPHRH